MLDKKDGRYTRATGDLYYEDNYFDWVDDFKFGFEYIKDNEFVQNIQEDCLKDVQVPLEEASIGDLLRADVIGAGATNDVLYNNIITHQLQAGNLYIFSEGNELIYFVPE